MAEISEINQAYFNKAASEYDQKYEKTLGQLEQELKASSDFIGVKRGGRLLDYACGTGLLSRSFGEQLSQCVGVDISESMVEAFNAKAKTEGKWPDKMAAHLGNLILPEDPSPSAFSGPEFFGFEIAGVGAGFHHFDDCDLAAQRLAARLAPGGVLFVLDFLPHAPDASVSHAVRHSGFSEGTMRAMFEGAGVGGGFAFKELDTEVVFHHSRGEGQHMRRRVFFARGTKV